MLSLKSSGVAKCVCFTLTELLVVIAILGILTSLLSTSLRRVMGKAQSLACLNQQKQIGSATTLYTNDYNGDYPAYYASASGPQHLLALYLGGNPNSSDMDTKTLRKNRPDEMLAANRLKAETWFCPSDVFSGGLYRDQIACSYYMNGFEGAFGPKHNAGSDDQSIWYGISGVYYTRNIKDIVNRTILFGCNLESATTPSGFAMYWISPYQAIRRWKVVNGLEINPIFLPHKSAWAESYHSGTTSNILLTDGSTENINPLESVDFNMNVWSRDTKNYPLWAINK